MTKKRSKKLIFDGFCTCMQVFLNLFLCWSSFIYVTSYLPQKLAATAASSFTNSWWLTNCCATVDSSLTFLSCMIHVETNSKFLVGKFCSFSTFRNSFDILYLVLLGFIKHFSYWIEWGSTSNVSTIVLHKSEEIIWNCTYSLPYTRSTHRVNI